MRPSALAARFSDDISARCSISSRLSWVPTRRRERLPFSVSTSSSVMVSDLVERLLRLGDDQRGHQLGERGDRQDGLRVLAEQDFVGVLIEDQRDAGLQVERIVGARAGRTSARTTAAPARRGRRATRRPPCRPQRTTSTCAPWRWRRSWPDGRRGARLGGSPRPPGRQRGQPAARREQQGSGRDKLASRSTKAVLASIAARV